MDREKSVAGTEEPKDPPRTAETPAHSSPPERAPDRSEVSQEHATPADAMPPESGAQRRESEERTKELLAAYQGTLDVAEDLPAVVWVRWGDRGLGHFLKVPYFRWFLRDFLTHHISKSLSVLNRRLHAIAALANDPDAKRPIVKP